MSGRNTGNSEESSSTGDSPHPKRPTLTSPMPYSMSNGRTKYSVGAMSRRHTPTNRYTATYNSSFGSSTSGTSYGTETSSRSSVKSTGYSSSGTTSPSKYSSDKYSGGTSGVSTLQRARDGLKPGSRPRALPPGPGPLDTDGNRIDHKYAVSSYKDYKPSSYHSRSRSLSRNVPLKAGDNTDTTTRTYSPSTSSIYSTDSPTPSGRLSRPKRTNSITDLSSNLDSMTVTTNFRSSKRFSSPDDGDKSGGNAAVPVEELSVEELSVEELSVEELSDNSDHNEYTTTRTYSPDDDDKSDANAAVPVEADGMLSAPAPDADTPADRPCDMVQPGGCLANTNIELISLSDTDDDQESHLDNEVHSDLSNVPIPIHENVASEESESIRTTDNPSMAVLFTTDHECDRQDLDEMWLQQDNNEEEKETTDDDISVGSPVEEPCISKLPASKESVGDAEDKRDKSFSDMSVQLSEDLETKTDANQKSSDTYGDEYTEGGVFPEEHYAAQASGMSPSVMLNSPTSPICSKLKTGFCTFLIADLFRRSLRLPEAYFKPNKDRCFCDICHKSRGDELVYTRGIPPKDYALPIGWCKFGLKSPTRAEAEQVFQIWHVGFHGTNVSNIRKILKTGDLLMPGDITSEGNLLQPPSNHWDTTNPDMLPPDNHDVSKIYLSPSIKYAGCQAYAPKHTWNDSTSLNVAISGRVAFQVRIEPGSYDVSKQTIGARGTIDPNIPNDELEWSTKRRGVVILTALLVKVEP